MASMSRDMDKAARAAGADDRRAELATLERERQSALKAASRASQDRMVAELRLHEAILEASRLGVSMRLIASAVGLSHQRIHQIIHGR
jgi:hypothetical protein